MRRAVLLLTLLLLASCGANPEHEGFREHFEAEGFECRGPETVKGETVSVCRLASEHIEYLAQASGEDAGRVRAVAASPDPEFVAEQGPEFLALAADRVSEDAGVWVEKHPAGGTTRMGGYTLTVYATEGTRVLELEPAPTV